MEYEGHVRLKATIACFFLPLPLALSSYSPLVRLIHKTHRTQTYIYDSLYKFIILLSSTPSSAMF